MFSMSSACAPSPASAVATSPEARSSRKASADTATATSTASPRRFRAKPSMTRAREPSPLVGEGGSPRSGEPGEEYRLQKCNYPSPRAAARPLSRKGRGGSETGQRAPFQRSLPAHLPEPRQLVRVGGEDQILGGNVEGGNRIERQHVGALRDQPQRLDIGRLALLRIDDRIAALEQIAHLGIAAGVVGLPLVEPRYPGGDVVDGERAPGPNRDRRLAGAHGVAMRGVLHEPQIGPDADRVQIADDRLDLIAFAVAVEVDVEAVGVARFGEQLLRLRRVIGIARRGFVAAAELRGEA